MYGMTLSTDTNTVIAVLLPDNEWHTVEEGSFTVDEWRYVTSPNGQERWPVDKSPGFHFREYQTGEPTSGPLSSILAVRTK